MRYLSVVILYDDFVGVNLLIKSAMFFLRPIFRCISLLLCDLVIFKDASPQVATLTAVHLLNLAQRSFSHWLQRFRSQLRLSFFLFALNNSLTTLGSVKFVPLHECELLLAVVGARFRLAPRLGKRTFDASLAPW